MPTVGTQPTITIQPGSAILPVGTTNFSTTSIPAGYSTVSLTLPRNASWADSAGVEILEFIVDISLDGGVTFPLAEGFGVAGGTLTEVDKTTGLPIVTHTTVRSIPAPCTAKGRLVNHSGGTLTALSVTAAFN